MNCRVENFTIYCITLGFGFSSKDNDGDENLIRSYHRIVEAFKFSYAYRALLGDPDYELGIEQVYVCNNFFQVFQLYTTRGVL